ncbi:uncharacterized protein LOC104852780 isoform X2 [Fukomys damarensis]|uniref:uncharacterized protein LOC104852780 isoform X2 n=1 Tax=Fukomys damarensis TaxID=885580 RepID=UPI001455638C|nr:uncharacterized protein LOC104852780 isoform X2 [Fukomys damarensis]
MAAGPHPHLKRALPSLLNSCPAHNSPKQDVMNLERSPKKTNGKQFHDNHLHIQEDQEKAIQQIQLGQLCFPATTRPQAGRLRCPCLKSVPRELPESPRQAEPREGLLWSPPRSRVYLIIRLQNELTKCGILKNMSDYEDFWKLIGEEAHGTDIKEQLQKIKIKMLDPRYWPLVAPRRRETRSFVSTDQDNRPFLGKRIQTSLEPVPSLSQTQEEFQRPPPRNKIICKTNKKDSRSRIYLRCLHQMYSTSLANMEFSRRLLEKDGRFADVHMEGRTGGLVDYMVPDEHREQEEALPRKTDTGDPLPASHQPQAQLALTFLKCWSSGRAWRDALPKRGGQQVALHGMLKLPKYLSEPDPPRMTTAPDIPKPLTLEHMTLTHRVVEAKTGSQYWINYVDK